MRQHLGHRQLWPQIKQSIAVQFLEEPVPEIRPGLKDHRHGVGLRVLTIDSAAQFGILRFSASFSRRIASAMHTAHAKASAGALAALPLLTVIDFPPLAPQEAFRMPA
jgi:hypothetical protein